MKEESGLNEMNSEILNCEMLNNEKMDTSEIEKALAEQHNISQIQEKLPSQIVYPDHLSNDKERSHLAVRTPTIADVFFKNNFSTGNSQFNTIKCKNTSHQGKYLSFDIYKMSVICLKCREIGNTDTDLEMLNENVDEPIEDSNNKCSTYNCPGYPCLLCTDCNKYICHECLLNKHFKHKANSITYISNTFKDDIYLIHGQMNETVEKVNQIVIEKPNKKPDTMKDRDSSDDEVNKILDLIKISNNNILKTVTSTNNATFQEYCSSFQSIDKEAHDIDLVLSKIQTQYPDMENSFKSLIQILDNPSIKSSVKCDMRQKASETIAKIQTLLRNSNNSLNRLTQLQYNTQKKNDVISFAQENIGKNSIAFEDSVLFSIKSGSNNNSIHLNRFRAYLHNSMIYFKNTSVSIKTNRSIHLTGLNLCGIYIHKHKLKNPNNEMHKMENRGSIDIKVTVFKSKGSEHALILSEKKKLYGAVNPNDPIISIYMSSGVLMESHIEYFVTIENLNTANFYGDFWSGSSPSNTHSAKKQGIKCNSTGTEVVFSSPEGIQSDFDEFSGGLIGGIIFTSD